MNRKHTLGALFSFVAVVAIIVAFGGMTVMADETSGYCGKDGDNLTWTLEDLLDNTGTNIGKKLVISGTGEMADYEYMEFAPWFTLRASITRVEIEDKVTSVGDYAFFDCEDMESVSFPSSLDSIGEYAFNKCYKLPYVSIPASSIGQYAFSESGVNAVFITGNVKAIEIGTFFNCGNLTKFQLPSTVESIETYAFMGCGFSRIYESDFAPYDSNVGDYVSNLKTIGDSAFAECGNLTSIELPNSVENIGASAFKDCGLTSFTIPYGVKTIENSTFFNCASLTTIIIPDSVTEIKEEAFECCSSLEEITIPKNVVSISEAAFEDAVSLTAVYCFPDPANLTCSFNDLFSDSAEVTVHVPGRYLDAYSLKFTGIGSNITFVGESIISGECGDNLTYVLDGDGVLVISGTGDMYDYDYGTTPWNDHLNDIKEVVIKNGVTSIGEYAFYYSQKLISVTIPGSVKSIGAFAFGTCFKLSSVTIPAGVTSIGRYAFYYCKALESVTIPNSVTEISEYAFDGCAFKEITLPNNITSIEENTFGNCTNLESIVIPAGVTSIGNSAFYYCTALESVTIPDSVTSIGATAFMSCTSIESITIPDNVTSIGAAAFMNCSSLKSLSMPESVNTLGENAFYSCSALEEIDLSRSNVTVINVSTFNGCTSLTSVRLSPKITAIGDSAFNSCSSLTGLRLPDTLTEIGFAAFENCVQLSSFSIPGGVTTIAAQTFNGCTALESIKISPNVTSIGHNAFKGCTSLKDVSIPDGVTEIDNEAFSNCESIKSVSIPGSVTSIGQKVFYGCSSLKSVTMHNGIAFINYAAFANCSNLETVVIPSTVIGIGQEAFNSDPNLTDIYCFADPANLTWDFKNQNLPSTLTVHVLSRYVEAYETMFAANNVDVTVVGDAEGDIDMGIGEHLYGYTLSLEGDIGVNFYMKFNDISALTSDAKMIFTITSTDGTHSRTQSVKVSSATQNGDYYIFKCKVNAKEMTSTIEAQMADGESKGKTYTYSVQEYAAYILNNPAKYDKEQALVKAMLNYGAYSQVYFDYNTDKLANLILNTADRDVSSVTADTLIGYKGDFSNIQFVANNGFITPYSANLSLESETKLNIKFKGIKEGTIFKLGDKVLPAVIDEQGLSIVTVPNITAKELDSNFTIIIDAGESEVHSFTYSPMNYCYNVLSRNRAEPLCNTVRALYLYNQAADAYTSN